jgi:hypothetical protein
MGMHRRVLFKRPCGDVSITDYSFFSVSAGSHIVGPARLGQVLRNASQGPFQETLRRRKYSTLHRA